MLEQFLGLWIDKNNNVLFIKSLKANNVKVSFVSGKTNSPVERCFMPQQLIINIEYDMDSEELIVQFGVRYFEPKLHLQFETTDIHNGKASLKPSYALSISTPKEKKSG